MLESQCPVFRGAESCQMNRVSAIFSNTHLVHIITRLISIPLATRLQVTASRTNASS